MSRDPNCTYPKCDCPVAGPVDVIRSETVCPRDLFQRPVDPIVNVLKLEDGTVPGAKVVKRGNRVLAEFFGHEATLYGKTFISALEQENAALSTCITFLDELGHDIASGAETKKVLAERAHKRAATLRTILQGIRRAS